MRADETSPRTFEILALISFPVSEGEMGDGKKLGEKQTQTILEDPR